MLAGTTLAGTDEDRLCLEGNTGPTAVLESEKRHALAIDGNIQLFEAGPVPEERFDGKDIMPIGGKIVGDDHAAARAKRGPLDMVPGML